MFAVFSPAAQSNITAKGTRWLFFGALFAALLTAHLRHAGVLWGEEDLPMAVALQMKRGAVIYRDAWFDKPPLVPSVYLLWGVATGPLLRLAGALYALLACALSYAIAARLWSEREGYTAAALLGFFLTFDTHSAVLPLAADLLLLVPHLAAVLLALRRQALLRNTRKVWPPDRGWTGGFLRCLAPRPAALALLSGVAAGIGFLCNAKAVLVLAACGLFVWPEVPALLAGFLIPNAIALGWLAAAGALPSYIDQVWRWPAQYAGSPVVRDPVANGALRTLNWLGFHAAIAIAAAVFWVRERRWKFIVWAVLGYVGVVLGWRFFPRYFFLLLPAMTIGAARGFAMLDRRVRWGLLCLLAIPLIRFGPRYVSLRNWSDLALEEDGRAASEIVRSQAHPGSTLYVWGYRPEIYIYTQMKPATRYLECQAMTGVPADRHLTQSTVVLTAGTHEAREELARSTPDIVVDGLSPFNPALSVWNYPELKPWIARYREIARTKGTIVYVRSTMR